MKTERMSARRGAVETWGDALRRVCNRIADVFMETAYRALRPGGRCLMVVKTATGLLALQEKYFRTAEVIKRRGYCVLRSVRT